MDQQFNPFQSPNLAPPAGPLSGAMSWIMPFESGHDRAKWAIVFLAIIAVLNIAGTVVGYMNYELTLRRAGPVTIEEPEGIANAVVGGLRWLAGVGAIIAFSMWTHRVSRNLPALGGRGLKYTPGWAVGWFFIPVANYVLPYFVTSEIWRESDPEQRHLDGQAGKRTSALVGWWWGANAARMIMPIVLMIVVFSVAGFAAARAVENSHATNQQDVASSMANLAAKYIALVAVATNAMEFVAAILAILVVRGIDKNQQAKYELILNEPTVI